MTASTARERASNKVATALSAAVRVYIAHRTLSTVLNLNLRLPMRIIPPCVSAPLLTLLTLCAAPLAPAAETQSVASFEKIITKKVGYHYLLSLPTGYDAAANKISSTPNGCPLSTLTSCHSSNSAAMAALATPSQPRSRNGV